jgi:RNA polymerase sigma-70 factor (ECF subfamily)
VTESTTVQIQGLLDRFLGGDATAKAALVRVAEERLLVLTRRLLREYPGGREHDDTEGIFQEAYLRFHSALDEVRPATVRQFLGLAAVAIRRTLLDLVRKFRGRGAERRNRPVSLDRGTTPDAGGYDPPAPEGPDRFTLTEDLFAAVDELPEELREVVQLHHFHGLAQAEIAALLGVHEDTIKRRWSKARIRLADKLAAFDPNG